jgi:hypothetical protein
MDETINIAVRRCGSNLYLSIGDGQNIEHLSPTADHATGSTGDLTIRSGDVNGDGLLPMTLVDDRMYNYWLTDQEIENKIRNVKPAVNSDFSDDYELNFYNLPPTAYIDSITPNPAEYGSAVEFTGHGVDKDGTITAYRWVSSIDSNLSDANYFSTATLSEGQHVITFRVKDDRGAWSAPVTQVLTVGNAMPVAYIDSIAPNPVVAGNTVTFTGHGTDLDGSIAGYKWVSSIDGNLSNESSFSTSFLTQGSHIISFTVFDNTGAESDPVTQTLDVQP